MAQRLPQAAELPLNSMQVLQAIPDQAGRRAIVTGANSGIGYFAALELARAGAQVIIAVRDKAKGESAVARIKAAVPNAAAQVGTLDLASLTSVREFAARELDRDLPLDLLINNAGVMAPPRRLESADGFELQFATNVLGHFALTGLLMPAIERAARRFEPAQVGSAQTGPAQTAAHPPQAPRIVYVASIAHKRGIIDFDDLQSTRSYDPMQSYAQTKLADLMLCFELDRRLRAAASPILSIAAHPGVSSTNLFRAGAYSPIERAIRIAATQVIGALLNTGAGGAVPTVFAAVSPSARAGGYYGPTGFHEMRGGNVGDAIVATQATDLAVAARLWNVCEELTGVSYR